MTVDDKDYISVENEGADAPPPPPDIDEADIPPAPEEPPIYDDIPQEPVPEPPVYDEPPVFDDLTAENSRIYEESTETGLPQKMPFSIEAEQTVLGAIITDPVLISTAMDHVKAESFYIAKHRQLFSVIMRLFTSAAGTSSIDQITVLNAAVAEGIFEDSSSGNEYLAELIESVPSLSNLESYCKIVEQKYLLRSLIEASDSIAKSCYQNPDDAAMVLDTAEQLIYDIRRGKEVSGLTRIDSALVNAYQTIEQLSGPQREKYLGIGSGFSDLDTVISGLKKSNLIILAARPGMGKTSFALNIAANVCREHKEGNVVIFSLEMSSEQLVTKMLSSESFVDSKKLRDGKVTSEDWAKLVQGAETLANMNLYIDDTAGANTAAMKAKLRRLGNVSLVIIDYLQLMNSVRKIDNRVNEISDITRQLKLMAKELDVPILLLSQLSRAVENRTGNKPQLSDLRESGSIEQDADIVMFLYREGYYLKEKSENPNLAECIVAKNRHGEIANVPLYWDGKHTLFTSAAKAEVPE